MASKKIIDIRPVRYPIELDKERHLRYDLNALAEVEDAFGSMGSAFAALRQGSMKAVRCLLWAGLLHEDPDLTLHDVGALVTMENLGTVSDAIMPAINGGIPEKEEKTEQEAKGEADPT